MRSFSKYEDAYEFARVTADQMKLSCGIEKNTEPRRHESWRVFLLPKKENRYGYELRCEVVDPSSPGSRKAKGI